MNLEQLSTLERELEKENEIIKELERKLNESKSKKLELEQQITENVNSFNNYFLTMKTNTQEFLQLDTVDYLEEFDNIFKDFVNKLRNITNKCNIENTTYNTTTNNGELQELNDIDNENTVNNNNIETIKSNEELTNNKSKRVVKNLCYVGDDTIDTNYIEDAYKEIVYLEDIDDVEETENNNTLNDSNNNTNICEDKNEIRNVTHGELSEKLGNNYHTLTNGDDTFGFISEELLAKMQESFKEETTLSNNNIDDIVEIIEEPITTNDIEIIETNNTNVQNYNIEQNSIDDITNKYNEMINSTSKDVSVSMLTSLAHSEDLLNEHSTIIKDINIIYNNNKEYYDSLIKSAISIQNDYPNVLMSEFNSSKPYDFTSNLMSIVKTYYNENMKDFLTRYSKLSHIEKIMIIFKVSKELNATLNSDLMMYELPNIIKSSNIQGFNEHIKNIPLFLSVYTMIEIIPMDGESLLKPSMVDLTNNKLNIFDLKVTLGITLPEIDLPYDREFRYFEYYDAPFIQYIISMLILNIK